VKAGFEHCLIEALRDDELSEQSREGHVIQ